MFNSFLTQIEHKIQSDDGELLLVLERVPKLIKPLVKEWSPEAFVTSFKVSTLSTTQLNAI